MTRARFVGNRLGTHTKSVGAILDLEAIPHLLSEVLTKRNTTERGSQVKELPAEPTMTYLVLSILGYTMILYSSIIFESKIRNTATP